jgi:hypothetical protein
MAPPWWSYLWDCCDGVYGTFRTIPTVESYGAGVFCSRQNPYSGLAVKRAEKEPKNFTFVTKI